VSTNIDAIKKYNTNNTKGLYMIISAIINAAIDKGKARRSQGLFTFELNLFVILLMRVYK
jgi:hypothetical protein